VVVVGTVLGGTLGLGTVVYAVAIGPLVQRMLPWAIVELPERQVSTDAAAPCLDGPLEPVAA
jgi:uncharacterized membrane protein YczE